MTRPKLVAFDLDDTLIGSNGKIAPVNFCALEQLSAAGVTAAGGNRAHLLRNARRAAV